MEMSGCKVFATFVQKSSFAGFFFKKRTSAKAVEADRIDRNHFFNSFTAVNAFYFRLIAGCLLFLRSFQCNKE